MKLDAVQAHFQRAVELFLNVRIVGVHGCKAVEFRVQLTLLMNEGIDMLDLLGFGGGGADKIAADADFPTAAEQFLGAAQMVHRDVVKMADALRRLFSDFGREDVRVCVVDFVTHEVPPKVQGDEICSHYSTKNSPQRGVFKGLMCKRFVLQHPPFAQNNDRNDRSQQRRAEQNPETY